MTAPRVNLAVPNYGSQVKSNFLRGLYNILSTDFRDRFSISYSEIDYADLVASRNFLISDFYYNKEDCSHLLMIDTDMGFGADLIADMLNLDRPVVGVIYPRRSINLRRLHSLANLPYVTAYARSLDFIGEIRQPQEVMGPFVRMKSCGSGILLISRKCITQMITQIPGMEHDRSFRSHIFSKKLPKLLTLFDHIKTASAEYSEDLSFSRRWVEECGGEIWASYRHRVSHVVSFPVSAAFAETISTAEQS